MGNSHAEVLQSMKTFFHNTLSVLDEDDSGYTPVNGIWTVAQHVAHTAQTIDWFVNGVFSETGFDMDFERLEEEIRDFTSLNEALDMFDKAVDNACEVIGGKSQQELMEPIPKDQIMGGAPRMAVIGAMSDHTAHHRGALSVYARMLGKTPKMPYGDM